MSDTPASYHSGFIKLTTEQVEAECHSAYAYAFTAPALLTPAQLAALSDALAEERQGCEAEPATPLGFWATAVAALLGHVEETAHELSYERQMRQQTEEAMVRLVRRVKEQQDELAEQEVAKLALIAAMGATRLLLESALGEWEGDNYITQGPQQDVKRNLSDAIDRLV